MNRSDLLADSLRLHLRSSADERPGRGQLETILSQTATIRPRSNWHATMHRGTTGIWVRAGATPALRLAGVVLIALLAMLAVALVVGQRQRVGGLLGFARDGSVFISKPGNTSSVLAAAVPGYYLNVMTRERAWSPDGRYLAVDGFETPSSDPESPPTAFVLDSRTLDLRRIGQGYFLGWMPDGRALVASGDSSVATYSIGEQTIEMTGQVRARVSEGSGVLSPDGHWLAMMEGQFLARVNVQTGETKLLYENGGELVDTPAWSPDSSRIAFARTLSPRCHTCMGPILVVTADGSRVTPVSRPDTLAFRPKWSPNGEWLAYITDVTDAGVENSSIEIARPDGTERRTLSTGRPADLAWSPDGTRIRYQTDALDEAESRYTLVEIDPMDGQTGRVDDGAGVEGFAWQSLPGGSSIPPLPHEVR